MSSPKTRQRKQARLHAHQLAKIATDALAALNHFVENNEEHLTENPEATFSLTCYELEDMEEKLRMLSESYAGGHAAPIYIGTIDRLGRVEIRDKVTGNLLHSFKPSDDVAEYLRKHNYQLREIELQWHPEEFDREKLR